MSYAISQSRIQSVKEICQSVTNRQSSIHRSLLAAARGQIKIYKQFLFQQRKLSKETMKVTLQVPLAEG